MAGYLCEWTRAASREQSWRLAPTLGQLILDFSIKLEVLFVGILYVLVSLNTEINGWHETLKILDFTSIRRELASPSFKIFTGIDLN